MLSSGPEVPACENRGAGAKPLWEDDDVRGRLQVCLLNQQEVCAAAGFLHGSPKKG